jgi:hypothetical protein
MDFYLPAGESDKAKKAILPSQADDRMLPEVLRADIRFPKTAKS